MSNTTAEIIVDATPEAKAAFFSELQTYVGLEIGAPTPAPHLFKRRTREAINSWWHRCPSHHVAGVGHEWN
jgi:hypothetical protein